MWKKLLDKLNKPKEINTKFSRKITYLHIFKIHFVFLSSISSFIIVEEPNVGSVGIRTVDFAQSSLSPLRYSNCYSENVTTERPFNLDKLIIHDLFYLSLTSFITNNTNLSIYLVL